MIQNFFCGGRGRGGGGGGSLSPPRLNIFTVGNMGVMICLGQGDLCSLSASCLLYPSPFHLSLPVKPKHLSTAIQYFL